MAFETAGMGLLNPGGNARLYVYSTTDAIASVVAADYFLPFHAQLQKGDCILVAGSTGGTPTADLLVVNAVSSSGVTVVNGT